MFLNRLNVGVLVALLLVSCGNSKQEAPKQEAPVYPTTVLSEQNTVLETVYPATIKGQEDIEIRPRIDGFIDAIYVDEGALVRKGQALFKINSPQSEQALLSAQAAVNSAQAALNTAQLNVERIRPLAQKGIVSNVQLETTENAYESSKAAFAQAQATLSNAKATMGWTSVTSPVDGIVGSIPYRQGSLVDKSYVLTTVANTNNVYVYFSLNEKDLMDFLQKAPGKTQAEKIKNMPELSLILADGTVYPEKGKISTISGLVNTTTGSVNFRADFPNPHGLLRSGTSGKISIPRHLENVLLVPQKATFAQQDKVLVYKVQGDSVVQTPITVLQTPGGQEYAVTAGLSAGDRIVADGVATLTNGKKIKVQ
ncbi:MULTISPECIES: efflux RND transporter periplasmic adaptor subunit [unclassified Dysgonomonas]|uniref:efflux RND transporter periplasmic adaptor subunit n=1 Tax=unclassified Dysgonomonas TaxID=2630389 RepID=UPI0006832317|nr:MULTISPECIES: efflux RND transporter periplasmic adaptor subunit [unclassified Dysgonomonas]MBD8348072.1 efflux RND transporter periplasmic adaptor subunit [Dysgonomonas sp. HGC4]MBF0575954.1 efflux RND transporter periplasmic adaptor subunit [Dysgonomonas sp. GY617]